MSMSAAANGSTAYRRSGSSPHRDRYLSLSELHNSVRGRAKRSWTRTVDSAAIRVELVASRSDLFARVVGLSVNAVHENWNGRAGVFDHADRLSGVVELDMTKLWSPTAASYLERITKVGILQDVAEAGGQSAADRIAYLRKTDMATEAEAWLAGANWLPDVRRPVGGNAAGAMIEDEGQS